MVLTRSQAAKQKAHQSPEAHRPSKHAATADAQPGGGTAQPSQPLADKLLNVHSGMGSKASKLSRLRTGPCSHPITSLPGSPAVSPGPGTREFTIAAVQQQAQQAELGQALAAVAAAQAGAGATEGEQQPAAEASSVEKRQPEGEEAAAGGLQAAAIGEQATASDPAAPVGMPAEHPAAPQQQAQPPAPQPRPEKLLKRLPDKAVPCDKLPDGPEPVVVDVEYVASQDLQPVADSAAAVAAVVPALEAAEWVEAVKAINLLRQLVVHHPEACAPQLNTLMPLLLKSVRSLRSSVCKTAIMAVADVYTTYGDLLLPHTDVGGQLKPTTSLLAQMLLKCSSNDKKFVIEEAQRAMQVMVDSLSAGEALRLLLPYADLHKNPKVRGKAGGAVAAAVGRMQPRDVLAFGHPRLLKVAGKLVTDNTPDARDSAKKVIGLLKAAFADPAVEAQLAVEVPAPAAPAEGEEAPKQPTKWEAYCQASLSVSAALAVLKASSE